MKLKIFFLCLSFCAVQISNAQDGYEQDALRYSQNTISGSARTQAIGGANVAIGGDISSANINPAGLGLFKKSEFSVSAALGGANTNSHFLESQNSSFRSYLGFPNFGLVFSNAKDDIIEGKYRGGAFSVSFSKTNNFQNQVGISGMNYDNSIGDFFAEQAYGIDEREFSNLDHNEMPSLVAAAYESEIIDPIYIDSIRDPYYSYQYTFLTDRQRQNENILTKGGQYSWDFAYGGNYDDKLYFGIGIGIARINYSRERFYNEEVPNPELTSITLFDKYTAKGTGINIKGGLIFKPTDFVRVGVAFQSPTYYSIKESWNSDMNSELNGITLPLYIIPGENKFNLNTPAKISPGVAFIIGKSGFITGDVDFISYNAAHVGGSDIRNEYSYDNQRIRNLYSNAVNFKIGGEYRYDIFRLRGGFAHFGDPIKNNTGISRDMLSITGGAGIRVADFYCDVAIVHSKFKSLYKPYTLIDGSEPTANIDNNLTTLNFTFGAFF